MSEVTMTPFEQRFRNRTPRSAALFRQARSFLPGGLTRSTLQVEPYPLALASGSGATVVDVDGNPYIDLVNNYTALVHGNAHPATTAAIAERFTLGAALASPHEAQIRLAELIAGRLPSVELLRFTNSGSEAATLAVRIARRATGRRKLVMFEGGYHGTGIPLADPDDDVTTIPYNDVGTARETIGADVAAVFAEPFLGAGGVIPAAPGFLASVQELCRRSGALFVLDEVQSLRNGVGGAQVAEGLLPDLTLMGKVIGGGLPIGAVGGRRDLLALTDATREQALSHSGTMNGHLAAMVAGAVTLELLTKDAITELIARASGLAAAIESAGAASGLLVAVTQAGSILNVHFSAQAPRSYREVATIDTPLRRDLYLELLNQGVYTTPRGMINLSTVITETQLAAVADAYARVFAEVADRGN
jgi:glutamate-1-semialdehyde 2,1-aminomutase